MPLRCISFWSDPKERCLNFSEKKFCEEHSYHYKYYREYKKLGLCRLETPTPILYQKEIDARKLFIEKAICEECRDSEHHFFIEYLENELEQFDTPILFQEKVTEKEPEKEPELVKDDEKWNLSPLPAKPKSKPDWDALHQKMDAKEDEFFVLYGEACKELGFEMEDVIRLGFLFTYVYSIGTKPYPISTNIQNVTHRMCFLRQGLKLLGVEFASAKKDGLLYQIHPDTIWRYRVLAYWVSISSQVAFIHGPVPEDFPQTTYPTKKKWVIFFWSSLAKKKHDHPSKYLILEGESRPGHAPALDVFLADAPVCSTATPNPTMKKLYLERKIFAEDILNYPLVLFSTLIKRLTILSRIINEDCRKEIVKSDIIYYLRSQNYVKHAFIATYQSV